MRLFLRARAVINFLMRAATTLEITNGEQRALRKFSASWNLSLLKRNVIWLTLSKQDNRRKARQHDKALSLFNHSQLLTANYALFNMPFAAKLLNLDSRESVGRRSTESEAF